jgi:hypothetical protein
MTHKLYMELGFSDQASKGTSVIGERGAQSGSDWMAGPDTDDSAISKSSIPRMAL